MELPRIFRESKKAALPPGTIVHVGEKPPEKAKIHMFHYDEQTLEETDISDLEQCRETAGKPGVAWIDVCGIHDTEIIKTLGTLFDIHLSSASNRMNEVMKTLTIRY